MSTSALPTLSALYAAHISQLQQHTADLLQQQGYAGLLIHSGSAPGLFLDDHHLPFYANPHFKHWLPLPRHQHGFLLIRPNAKPQLYYHNPSDYWHLSDGTPHGFWTAEFEITEISAPEQVREALSMLLRGGDLAFIGEDTALAARWGIVPAHINPESLLHPLHWQRAYKSEYELACLREASRRAVAGHRAAEQAFRQGDSELEIHLAYLAASQQRENELPYGNIIALNQHGAVLHYQHLERQPPRALHAFLIDAGAEVRGYCADITRTYAAAGGLFGEMIVALDQVQQRLVAQLQPGQSFVALHQQTHLAIGLILQAFKLVDMSPESQVECGITRAFYPHGLGHLLGLQVHDVAGKVSDAAGTPLPPPAEHPALRLTRPLEAGMVLTIEPGLYFIDALLAELRQSPQQVALDWSLIAQLSPCGGIRIEDNLVIHPDRVENLTRDAFGGP
ncbi:MAG TPA: Xaa-Pro dipeptidase [Motiliproteus sp.]